MSSSSKRLREKVLLVLPEYRAPGRLLLDHPDAADLYPGYLSRIYYLPRTAIALLETALQRARALADDDAVAAGLVPYLEQHIVDELHDAEPGEAVLADLEVLGVDVDDLRSRPAPARIAAVVGAQYFWILHGHPVSVLGYLSVIEGFHPQVDAIERLAERTGHPRAAFRQLLQHADVDVGHAQELDVLLDALPLEPWHEQLLAISAFQTVELLTEALLEVLDAPGVTRVAG